MERVDFERLRWRCIRRGLLELDIVLSHFLAGRFADLSGPQQEVFAELANMEDHQLWGLINDTVPCSDSARAEIVAMLREMKKTGLPREND